MKGKSMNYSCCIDMMFSELDFYGRISEVKKCGIDAVEFWKWSNKDIERVCNEKEKNGLGFSVFNIDCKNASLSNDLSRGILNVGRKEEFLSALDESIPIYRKLGACGMIVLVGETSDSLPIIKQLDNVYDCLNAAAPVAEKNGINLVVEPLNNIDRKNYFMPYANDLFEILKSVKSPSVKMLYDIYHQNMMGDFSIESIRENIDFIGHFHVADCPGRHEPGTGNVDYRKIISEIKETGYKGYIGLEYRATKRDSDTFGFLEGDIHRV